MRASRKSILGRLLALSLLACAVVISSAANASASQPTFTKIVVDDTFQLVDTSAICGFPVFEHDTGTVTTKTTTLVDGSVRSQDLSVHIAITFYSTDPAHPGTVTTHAAGPFIATEHPDGSVTLTSIGQSGHVTAPGEGTVFASAGINRVEINASGNVTEISHGNFSPDHSGLCPLL
jgi:ABC-type phosphate transport system substrate-binding protein